MKRYPTQKTGFVWHEIYMWHDTSGFCGAARANQWVQPEEHYESPEAKRRIRNLVEVSGLLPHLIDIPALDIEKADLLHVHTNDYVERVHAMRNRYGELNDELPLGIASVDIAEKAVGGAIAATKAVMNAEVDNAYAILRPPGHHAEPNEGMGFCTFANGAIAGATAMVECGAKRIAFVDWDVHHGNGTEACFYDNPNALTISLHQADWYPQGRGRVEGDGHGKN